MSLIDRMGYAMPEPNRFHRLLQAAAATRPGAAVLSRILMPMDQLLGRIMNGGASFPQVLAGLPVVSLSTRGRRSGQERRVVLIAIPFGDTLTLIGTNWGRASAPSWVLNLQADPRARLEYRGVTHPVVARLVDDEEHAEVMAVAARHYAGFLAYQRRITERPIRVFALHPDDD